MINIQAAGYAVSGATKSREDAPEQLALTADVKKQLTAVATVKGSVNRRPRVTAAQALITSSPATSDGLRDEGADAAIDALAEKVARPGPTWAKKQQAAATAHALPSRRQGLDMAREALSDFSRPRSTRPSAPPKR
ncbi:MAG: hypothetical protein IPP57_13915 [Candidatus Obscuribacter sp.]|nr:hypothetical protein [Candidatus Obscuribacter sp.]